MRKILPLFLTLLLAVGLGLAQTSDGPTPDTPKPPAKSSHKSKAKKSKPKKAAKKPKKSPKKPKGKTRQKANGGKANGEPQVETEITQKAVTIDLQGK